MAGLSSRALSTSPENQTKYNGIEFLPDLEVNTYDAFYRELDGQIGKWWQIDPVTDGYEEFSPYASNYNNPITYADYFGDEGSSNNCCGDVGKAAEDLFDYVMINGSGLLNGLLNFASAGLISTDPFNFRDKLSTTQKAYYDGAVQVGQIAPILSTGGRALRPRNVPVAQTSTGVTVELPSAEPVSLPSASKSTSNKNQSQKQTGSYTNTHESGKTYSGKGPESRAKESAKRVAKENKDPSKKTDWKPAKNNREAFKAEDKRIQENGGAGNTEKNYNKRNSPGKKYNEQDKRKK